MPRLSDLIRFQIAHSAWALGELIRHARTLPPEAIERNLGIGPGSLRENLSHTIEAIIFFAENFAGREFDAGQYSEVEPLSKSLDGLEQLLFRSHDRLRYSMEEAIAKGLPDRILWPNAEGGSMPASVAIAQVFDHATLHRAQCVNMLKQLGIDPAPDLDPMTFLAAGQPSPYKNLWLIVREHFDTNDGSLPFIDFVGMTPDELRAMYAEFRSIGGVARSAGEPATIIMSVTGEQILLDKDPDPVGYVIREEAADLSGVLEEINIGGTRVPDLGFQIHQDSFRLDYRMGEGWGPREAKLFFELIDRLLSHAPNCRIEDWWMYPEPFTSALTIIRSTRSAHEDAHHA